MTFEEFFKKKKIDLAALQQADPALFSEFKTHYEQMGERSFDHTKKYWFNKTRRQFPLAPEIKTEKIHLENQIAEQTITETLTEPAAAAADPPKMGFVPKFRAGNMARPVADNIEAKNDAPAAESTVKPAAEEGAAAKPAYVPRFKMKPKTDNEPAPQPADEAKPEPTAETGDAKPAYKPRFNPKSMPPKPAADEAKQEPAAETGEAKPAYKPRFNPKTMPPKPPAE